MSGEKNVVRPDQWGGFDGCTQIVRPEGPRCAMRGLASRGNLGEPSSIGEGNQRGHERIGRDIEIIVAGLSRPVGAHEYFWGLVPRAVPWAEGLRAVGPKASCVR